MLTFIIKSIIIIIVTLIVVKIANETGKTTEKQEQRKKTDFIINYTIEGLQAEDVETKQQKLNDILGLLPGTSLIRKFKQWK